MTTAAILVFGPHPDDLEIGLAGTIARHTAAGDAVGLCDLTAGEMGSNGTVEERLAGTLACVAWAQQSGVHIVRVHDVKPAVDVVRMLAAIGPAAGPRAS